MSLAAYDLRIFRRDRLILDDVSVSICPGQVTAVIGPNGAGKSTLLSVLSGFEKNWTGQVKLDGKDIKDIGPSDLAKVRAVMAQSNSIVFDFSVEEILLMGWVRDSFGRSPIAKERVLELSASCGISDLTSRSFLTLSGGEKQRVQFCRSLVQLWRPTEEEGSRYLLLDEPTSSLDVAHELKLLNLMVHLSRQGTGILVILHDLNLASYFADRLYLIDQGKLIAEGTPREVMDPEILSEVYQSPITVEIRKDRLYIHTY